MASSPNRKPHILRVKREIVSLVDTHIESLKRDFITGSIDEREIALWIRQRNKVAKDADMEPIELNDKSQQGTLIYKE